MTHRLSLRERNRIRTTNEILDAAAVLLGGSGIPFTIEDLAKRAGVSRGTVYAYFEGGRDEIVAAVYVRAANHVRERAELLRAEQIETADRIGALARGFLEIAAEPKGRFYGAVGPEVAAVVAEHLGSTSSRLTELIHEDLSIAETEGRLGAGLSASPLAMLLAGAIRAAGERAAREPGTVDMLVDTIRALAVHAMPPLTERKS